MSELMKVLITYSDTIIQSKCHSLNFLQIFLKLSPGLKISCDMDTGKNKTKKQPKKSSKTKPNPLPYSL